MKKHIIDDTGYAGDADYRLALEELDSQFPGTPASGRHCKPKRPLNGWRKFVLKFGLSLVIVAAVIALLKFIFPVLLLLPLLYFVMKL
jgi:hypothetical protein